MKKTRRSMFLFVVAALTAGLLTASSESHAEWRALNGAACQPRFKADAAYWSWQSNTSTQYSLFASCPLVYDNDVHYKDGANVFLTVDQNTTAFPTQAVLCDDYEVVLGATCYYPYTNAATGVGRRTIQMAYPGGSTDYTQVLVSLPPQQAGQSRIKGYFFGH